MLLAMMAGVVCTAHAAPHDGIRVTDNLYGAKFVDVDNGWAVGAFGTIVRTRDGGNTWRPQVSHTVEHLYSVDFADAQHGWAVGRVGTVLHTNDGGDTWEAQKTRNDQHLFKVSAVDANHAWAIGDWGTILSTVDGGATWQWHLLERDVILNGAAWPDEQHGWIVGEAGLILHTSDAGATWQDQVSGVEKTLFGVCFSDTQHGWASGLDGLILRTVDGGQHWEVQRGNSEVGALEQVGYKDAFDNPSLYDIAVVGRYGYAVGDNGGVFVSDDSGATWHRQAVPAEAELRWIRALSVVPGTHGILVGANGLTVRVTGDQVTLPAEKDEHAAATPH